MNKEFFKGLILGFCFLFVGSSFLMWYSLQDEKIPAPVVEQTLDQKYVDKMQLILGYIDDVYVGEPYDKEELLEKSYTGMVDALGDRYSTYYSPKELDVVKDYLDSTFFGIGAEVRINDKNYPYVSKVIGNSPAEAAGLLKGDIFLMADDHNLEGVDLDTAVSYIRGDKGTKVKLKIQRGEEIFEIEIVRDEVTKETVTYEILEGNVGYIKVKKFEAKINQPFEEAINTLKSKTDGIIIDLRDNPGGYLGEACAMLECFVPKGELLVYQLDKKNLRKEDRSETDDTCDVPIVILINGGSASASEVFTGCLLDYNGKYVNVTTVGEKSFGKGIVQTQYQLQDGSAIKLTTAYYYSPNGTNIHGKGFVPDIEVLDDPETEIDEQLQAAIEVFKK